jgi:hypothetical protein
MRNIGVKCDKCGRAHDLEELAEVPPGFRVLTIETAHGDQGRRFDVCTDCVALLRLWFERMPTDIARVDERKGS